MALDFSWNTWLSRYPVYIICMGKSIGANLLIIELKCLMGDLSQTPQYSLHLQTFLKGLDHFENFSEYGILSCQ